MCTALCTRPVGTERDRRDPLRLDTEAHCPSGAVGVATRDCPERQRRAWDDFESTFRTGRQEWLLASPGHPKAAEIRDWLDARERQYVTVYREVFGFVYLVLAH